MKTLVIVAHGSRLQQSNDEVINFSNKLKDLNKNKINIRYAFLELTKPSITECIEDIINNEDAREIQVLPYFLAEGKHVKVDIPNEIEELRTNNKNVEIELLPHLGKFDGLANFILTSLED